MGIVELLPAKALSKEFENHCWAIALQRKAILLALGPTRCQLWSREWCIVRAEQSCCFDGLGRRVRPNIACAVPVVARNMKFRLLRRLSCFASTLRATGNTSQRPAASQPSCESSAVAPTASDCSEAGPPIVGNRKARLGSLDFPLRMGDCRFYAYMGFSRGGAESRSGQVRCHGSLQPVVDCAYGYQWENQEEVKRRWHR